MSFSILHQVGHNASWNIESLTQDGCGDGLILSPVHQSLESVKKIKHPVKSSSVFDPQFYLPSSQKNKFRSYPFFPETATDGFSTVDYTALAEQVAEACIKFQIEQGFPYVVIPMRYLDQMYPDYRERQEVLTVLPFIKAIRRLDVKVPVYVTLPLTSHMIDTEIFREQLLNWVTGFPEIDGVYLITAHQRQTKQIQDPNFIFSLMSFACEIRSTGMSVILGYLNTESLIMSILGDSDLTIGTFDNTRIFSIDKFVATEEEKRGPRPRIYLSGLMNWIRFDQAKSIMTSIPKVWDKIYYPTSYADTVLAAKVEPHFSQPGLYKHHLISICKQLNELRDSDTKSRLNLLADWLDDAKAYYKSISKAGIELDIHGAGGHIGPWTLALAKYAKTFI